MLDNLKSIINAENEFTSAMESAAEQMATGDDDVKDMFLDEPEAMVLGAENDPEIEKLVDEIPESDDTDPATAEDIKNIEESIEYIPESMINTEDAYDFEEDPDFGDLTAELEAAITEVDDETETDDDYDEGDGGDVTKELEAAITEIGEDAYDFEEDPDTGDLTEELEAAITEIGEDAYDFEEDPDTGDLTEELKAAITELGEVGDEDEYDDDDDEDFESDIIESAFNML